MLILNPRIFDATANAVFIHLTAIPLVEIAEMFPIA